MITEKKQLMAKLYELVDKKAARYKRPMPPEVRKTIAINAACQYITYGNLRRVERYVASCCRLVSVI